MTSPEELLEALDTFQKEYNGYLELTEKILPGQPKEVQDFIESMLESLTLYNLSINRIKDGFATFKVEYDNQLHVSRKQLSELINKYPSYRLMSRHPTVREFTDFILLRDDHFEKLKELFEATQK